MCIKSCVCVCLSSIGRTVCFDDQTKTLLAARFGSISLDLKISKSTIPTCGDTPANNTIRPKMCPLHPKIVQTKFQSTFDASPSGYGALRLPWIVIQKFDLTGWKTQVTHHKRWFSGHFWLPNAFFYDSRYYIISYTYVTYVICKTDNRIISANAWISPNTSTTDTVKAVIRNE